MENRNIKIKRIYLGVVEIVEIAMLITCLICFYTIGLSKAVYISLVCVLPFIFTCVEFYPTMDIFQRIRIASYLDLTELGFFFADLVLFITSAFLLNGN